MMGRQDGAPTPSPSKSFTEVWQAQQTDAERYARRLVAGNEDLHWPDEQDIFTMGLAKLWRTYFKVSARQCYAYRSVAHERALVRKAVRTTACNLIARRRRERAVLKPVELDAPTGADTPLVELLPVEDFTAALHFEIDLINYLDNALRNPLHRLVFAYLIGWISQEDLGAISAVHLRVVTSRLKRSITTFLAMYQSMEE